MERVRKDGKYTVPQFLDWLKHINMLLSQFPSETDSNCFTPTEIKKIFYCFMPTLWYKNF